MTGKTNNQFKGLEDRIEIFRSGVQTDSAGTTREFTNSDLDQMVETFDQDHPFPHVFGHPEHDDPALGWATSVSRDGDSLYLDGSRDLQPSFIEAVNSGAYRNRSISVRKTNDGKFKIAHLGWLGAVPPAIEGMKPLAYKAADDEQVYEFAIDEKKLVRGVNSAAWGLRSIQSMIRRMKNRLIESVGVEKADEEFPEYELESISDGADKLNDISLSEQGHMYSNPAAQSVDLDNEEDSSMAKANDKPAQFTQADLDDAAKAAEERAERNFKHNQACIDLVDSWGNEGKLTPAMTQGLSNFLAALPNEDDKALTFSLGSGDEVKEVSETPFQFASRFFGALPNNFAALTQSLCNEDSDTGEPADLDSTQINNLAQKYKADQRQLGIQITLAQAIEHVSTAQ